MENMQSGREGGGRNGELWLNAGAAGVCVSLLAAMIVFPSVLEALGAERVKALPTTLKIVLETLPLQGALLASALLPALLFAGGGGLLARLQIKKLDWKQLRFLLLFELLLFPSLTLVSGAVQILFKLFGQGVDTQQLVVKQALQTSWPGFALLAGSAALLAPLAEELAYRRVLFGFFKSFAGTFPAAITTAAVFAASHCAPAQLPTLFLLGLALQWACLRTGGSLSSAILLHALHNAASMSVLLAARLFSFSV